MSGKRSFHQSGGPSKKFHKGDDKGEDDEWGEASGFESQLAAMLDDEDEIAMLAAAEVEEQQEEQAPTIPESGSRTSRWVRPTPPELKVKTEPLIFQQIDLDHYIGKPMAGMPGASKGPVPVVRMFGVTKGGNSVCCHVHGYHPYMFTPAPPGFKKEHLSAFRAALNSAVMADMKSNKDDVVTAVLDVQLLNKSTIYTFQVLNYSFFASQDTVEILK